MKIGGPRSTLGLIALSFFLSVSCLLYPHHSPTYRTGLQRSRRSIIIGRSHVSCVVALDISISSTGAIMNNTEGCHFFTSLTHFNCFLFTLVFCYFSLAYIKLLKSLASLCKLTTTVLCAISFNSLCIEGLSSSSV